MAGNFFVTIKTKNRTSMKKQMLFIACVAMLCGSCTMSCNRTAPEIGEAASAGIGEIPANTKEDWTDDGVDYLFTSNTPVRPLAEGDLIVLPDRALLAVSTTEVVDLATEKKALLIDALRDAGMDKAIYTLRRRYKITSSETGRLRLVTSADQLRGLRHVIKLSRIINVNRSISARWEPEIVPVSFALNTGEPDHITIGDLRFSPSHDTMNGQTGTYSYSYTWSKGLGIYQSQDARESTGGDYAFFLFTRESK